MGRVFPDHSDCGIRLLDVAADRLDDTIGPDLGARGKLGLEPTRPGALGPRDDEAGDGSDELATGIAVAHVSAKRVDPCVVGLEHDADRIILVQAGHCGPIVGHG